jgi:hypothetical protein
MRLPAPNTFEKCQKYPVSKLAFAPEMLESALGKFLVCLLMQSNNESTNRLISQLSKKSAQISSEGARNENHTCN